MTQDLVLLKTEAAPAPVGITDHSFRVGDQNQALGVTEDFAGEIPLFLELGLRLAEAGDAPGRSALRLAAAPRRLRTSWWSAKKWCMASLRLDSMDSSNCCR